MSDPNSAAALRAAADRLVNRVSHWTPARWERPVRADLDASGPPIAVSSPAVALTRADLVFGLVQELADLAAQVEARPRRDVPRLDNKLALPDQVRVMVADLLAADPPTEMVHAATATVDAATRALQSA